VKPLEIRQRAFKADEITYLDRKSISLDRMLLKLFETLRYDGRSIVRSRRRTITVPALVKLMQETPDRFSGFDQRSDVARAWIINDLFEVRNPGKDESETVIGPRPFHLNAFKLANTKAADDFGASMQVWAMLYHADRPLLQQLKNFFGRGLDLNLDRYDGSTSLDLETLAILGMVDQVTVNPLSNPPLVPVRPLCLGQARIMADDLRKLLAYEDAVPRHVLAEYMRTIMGLHLSLYMLRLFQLVPDWVSHAQRGEACPTCPIDMGTDLNMASCPHSYEIVVDLTENASSPMAALSQASAVSHLSKVSAYVRAVIMLNRVKEFAAGKVTAGKLPSARTVQDLLSVISNPPLDMDGFFATRINDVLTNDPEEEEDLLVKSVLTLTTLSPLEQYVELVCLQRMKEERKKLISSMLDSIAQKNKTGGFLKQTAGARSPRWFVFGSNLLETLVQIAVLERDGGKTVSRNLLINDFLEWLRIRYGFVIYAPAYRHVLPEEQEIWRMNELALRERLHQIGFFTDLSDAYNSQTLRPRYTVR
jgi:hypothetical protein